MTDNHELGLRKIRRALISVSDKTGIVEFARELKRFDVAIVSTGGTAKELREAGLDVVDVSDVTGFPEMMDGRVKTLHPKIHGALLAVRDNPAHQAAMAEHGIDPIDMVVVNLYPFEKTISKADTALEDAIEQIDIGGPAMIRSAAKNHHHVTVVVSPQEYGRVEKELKDYSGATTLSLRTDLAVLAFQRTAIYDALISTYLTQATTPQSGGISSGTSRVAAEPGGIAAVAGGSLTGGGQALAIEQAKTPPDRAQCVLRKSQQLRYGENPHQIAALYGTGALAGVAKAEVLSGKEMSFNNYVDADAAWQLVCDFEENSCAIIKHTNPAGVGQGATTEEAYRRALATDPISAFGGVVAFNKTVAADAAKAVTEIFTEVILAPEYEVEALQILRLKKNLRVLRTSVDDTGGLEWKQVGGGLLVQTRDTHKLAPEDLKVVSHRGPTPDEIRALLFAWTVCKHTKSNAIVYARKGQTVGVGAGQMSRVDSVKIGAMRAQLPLKGSVLASDAFFPFRDGIDEAAKHGITAVIQPGGSVRDEEVIAAANEHDLAMVFTGVRHFKH